jgi:hypothetical protein
MFTGSSDHLIDERTVRARMAAGAPPLAVEFAVYRARKGAAWPPEV